MNVALRFALYSSVHMLTDSVPLAGPHISSSFIRPLSGQRRVCCIVMIGELSGLPS